MARRKRRVKRRVRYTARAPAKRVRRRRRSGGKNWQPLAYGLYGVGRGYVSNWVKSLPIPVVGQVGDEVLLLGAAWAAKRFVPNAMVKRIASAAMNVESYNLGRMVAAGGLGSMFGGAGGNGSSGGKLF